MPQTWSPEICAGRALYPLHPVHAELVRLLGHSEAEPHSPVITPSGRLRACRIGGPAATRYPPGVLSFSATRDLADAWRDGWQAWRADVGLLADDVPPIDPPAGAACPTDALELADALAVYHWLGWRAAVHHNRRRLGLGVLEAASVARVRQGWYTYIRRHRNLDADWDPTREPGPKTHTLKIRVEHFRAIAEGRKTFELRRNDRGFAVDDVLELVEIEALTSPTLGASEVPTGNRLRVRVVHVSTSGEYLQPGMVALGIVLAGA